MHAIVINGHMIVTTRVQEDKHSNHIGTSSLASLVPGKEGYHCQQALTDTAPVRGDLSNISPSTYHCKHVVIIQLANISSNNTQGEVKFLTLAP